MSRYADRHRRTHAHAQTHETQTWRREVPVEYWTCTHMHTLKRAQTHRQTQTHIPCTLPTFCPNSDGTTLPCDALCVCLGPWTGSISCYVHAWCVVAGVCFPRLSGFCGTSRRVCAAAVAAPNLSALIACVSVFLCSVLLLSICLRPFTSPTQACSASARLD